MKMWSFKFWVNAITIIALAALVFFAKDQIVEAFNTFTQLNLLWMLLVIPIQFFNHFSVANFYKSYLKSLGEKLQTKELFKISLEMNFVNNVFPSGGVSGFGYMGFRMKKLGVPTSKATLLQTSRHILTFLSFIVYLIIALVLLSLFGSASRFLIMIATGLSSLIIFGFFVLLYIISDEKRIKSFTAALPKLINRIVKYFHKNNKQPIDIGRVERLFGELHRDYLHVRNNWQDLRKPFAWSLTMNFTEILTIFVVYLAFGETVNPGAIIIAYAVANIAGLISVLPGGVGVYEGLMTAVMASSGVDKGVALSATVVYRVFNMSLFLPIGYFFYNQAIQSEGGAEIEKKLQQQRERD